MNGFDEFIDYIIRQSKMNEFFWPIVLVCVAFFFALLWLIFRKTRLWYWKVNEQVHALREIDLKLQEIGRGMKSREETPETGQPQISDALKSEETVPPGPVQTCRGKSGKIYTEAELEELIKE